MDNEIKTVEVNNCYVCGEKGRYLYKDLYDRFFGVEGTYNIMECKNPSCRFLWLNPQPVKESIPLLYRDYHTPRFGEDNRSPNFEKIIDFPFRIFYSLMKRLLLIRYERNKKRCMYLGKNGGRLLEVGCGNGETLFRLRSCGWDVEGVEINKKAVEVARERFGLKIYSQDLISLNLESQRYDAIIMNHVIEHLYDPVELLRECYRLLKIKGILVITTPNTESLGHKIFRSLWMGLDPPRHLYLFNPLNLKIVMDMAGFKKVNVFTSSAKAESFARGSLCDQGLKKIIFENMMRAFQLWERILHIFNRNIGEELVVIARR